MATEQSTSIYRIYGIKNCDTMKKTFTWCSEHGVDYEFHDYKKQGVDRERLAAWCKSLSWQALVNTKGPTWRKLSPEQQNLSSENKALDLMVEYPSLIRRPLLEMPDGELLIGFDPITYESKVR